ncbi:MAG: hypothetical protein U1A06_07520 [Hoeflea sp.]|uniref:hypothetical protein n=1 Tax=Hoeflea sp. TaxID=1940281 RepID=UPI00272FFD2C|nr:hypothetical protein [Hoeflea sp.]MDP2120525.1 hypothetical protein [Hoeflea sp.]MDZ7601208.1 hypothetical protein [Hoeflea sp.]
MVPMTAIIITYDAACQSISAKKHAMQRLVHFFYQLQNGRDVALGGSCRYIPCGADRKGDRSASSRAI